MARSKKRQIPEMTDAQRAALAEFQTVYGEKWRDTMIDFHVGKPEYQCIHIMHFVRQIRNNITANPTELPDLRALFAPAPCPDCGGEGAIDKTPEGVAIKVSEVCDRCGGKGRVFAPIDLEAKVEALTTQRDVLAAALAGEVMPDGHVRGCPARDNRDKRCNNRCFRVRAALTGIEGIEI